MRKLIFTLLITAHCLFASNTNFLWRTALVSSAITAYATNIFGASEGSVDIAISKQATLFKGNLMWDWKQNIASLGHFKLNIYKQVSYSKWSKRNKTVSADASSNNALDFNMVNRFENSMFLIEYSLGLSLMSNVSLERELNGGALYFNHILGAGIKYKNFKLIGRFQHYSNNGITEPNCAYNFYSLNFGWRY